MKKPRVGKTGQLNEERIKTGSMLLKRKSKNKEEAGKKILRNKNSFRVTKLSALTGTN